MTVHGSDTHGPSRRLLWAATAGAGLLAIASGWLFYHTMKVAAPARPSDALKVTVRDKVCEPNNISVAAGRVTFEIHNASNRTLEWEILDGVMVLEERENIPPGFHARLTANLKPGTYQITCGLLSNPHGTLTVTPSAASEAERMKPPLKSFIGPLSEFKVFLILQSRQLQADATKLADAIRGGDLAAARQAYLAARLPYKRIETTASLFSDLKNSIDPIADYLEKREADPAFTGFHRIEYGLFALNTTDGLSPVADRLVQDITTLGTRLRELKLGPEQLGRGSERQSRHLQQGTAAKGESRYAHADLVEFEATLDGMEKASFPLLPLVDGTAPDVAASVRDRFAAVRGALAALKTADNYPPYDRVDAAARDRLAQTFGDLADSTGRLNAALGLE